MSSGNGDDQDTCGDCLYLHRTGIGQGYCNRYPPTAIGVPVPGPMPNSVGINQVSLSPPVRSDRPACGEFVERA